MMDSSDFTQPQAIKCPQCGADLIPGEEDYILCPYCGSSLLWKHKKQGGGADAEQVVRGMRLKKFVYTDTEGTGLQMFHILAPANWQMQGGCRWLLDNPGMPATISMQIYNPHGLEAFEILPNMNFTWNNTPMSQMLFPVGSRYFGAEVRPLVSALDALKGFVLPRYRGGAPHLRLIREEKQPDLPNLVRSEAPISGGWADGGRVRIAYDLPAGTIEEEIYAVVEAFRIPMATMFATTELVLWSISYLFSFRAAAGSLDAQEKLFSTMIQSFQLNPQWYAAYKSLIQTLTQQQIQHIHHIGQISQIIAQTSDHIRQQNMQSWYNRQATYDQIYTNWSRNMRGVDGYYDPHREETVELPGGYGHAWANSLGEYILSDDSNFNPNLGSNLNWQPLKQQG